MPLTDDQLLFFGSHGYLIVRDFLTAQELQLYSNESQVLVNHCYEYGDIVDSWGCVVEPLGCAYFDECEVADMARTDRAAFVDLRSKLGPQALALCTLDKFGACAKQLLCSLPEGSGQGSVYLLNDQYIVKPPHTKAEFAYHQDTLYFSKQEKQRPIISAWTPLNDVSEANGTVMLDPFPDPANPGHYAAPTSSISGDRRPFWANMTAGGVLFMDGRLRHCSTGNRSASFRTVYMPQFSLGKVVDRGRCVALAVPVAEPDCNGSIQQKVT
ncbi:hypothetical protein GQ54DRAFT_139746 [Martensiomyces pterosporus]|nr:hypothetical protein GQ54DRAFT_139746 [Martensiomyces pterosporus]